MKKAMLLLLMFTAFMVVRLKAQSGDNEFTDARDGKKYKTIKAGIQTWMAENLAYKAKNGCKAYKNDESNAASYGYLYDYETAKKACPAGWHLPGRAEWLALIKSEGGDTIAGGKLKSTKGWMNPNKGATNESGFTCPAGGCWNDANGSFEGMGMNGLWWTATMHNAKNAWYFNLDYNSQNATLYYYGYGGTAGFSVRCVMDNNK
jgi:uncharacterized protein (TIGR02145 family)